MFPLPTEILTLVARQLRNVNDSATLFNLSLCSRLYGDTIRPILYRNISLSLLDIISDGQTTPKASGQVKTGRQFYDIGSITINDFNSPDGYRWIQDVLKYAETPSLYPNVRDVTISHQAMVNLFLKSPKDLEALYKAIPKIAKIAQPKHLQLHSIDNLRKPTSLNITTAFDVVDKLVDVWLCGGLQTITSKGPYHRNRPFLYSASDSPDLVHRIIWTNLTTPIFSPHQPKNRRLRDSDSWDYAPPLNPSYSETRRADYVADQAYSHVYAVITQRLKRSSGVILEIQCPELGVEGMKRVKDRLGEEIGAAVGGKADGMIEGYGRERRARDKVCVKVIGAT